MSSKTRWAVLIAAAMWAPTMVPTAAAEEKPLPIGTVQGAGAVSQHVGRQVTVEGVVTGGFQDGGLAGYYIQDGGDGNPATSDGIFVHAPRGAKVRPGARIRVTGIAGEHNGQTQIKQSAAEVLANGQRIVPTDLRLPLKDPERHEGMLARFPTPLTLAGSHNFGRFGEIVYTTSRQDAPTAIATPGAEAKKVASSNATHRLIVDDGRTRQNPTPAIHPNGKPVSATNYFRSGDVSTNLTGVLGYAFGSWRLHPTRGADYSRRNPRPDVPKVGGDLKVASMNVLNYFTTLTSQNKSARGADTAEEFSRQRAKIVAALARLDADVVGLMEIENNGSAVQDLVTALNAQLGREVYRAVHTGRLGSDAITQAFLYRTATVSLVGGWKAYEFSDGKNRPSLVQTFAHTATGERVNVAVNHLKSKGSACAGDPDLGDGAGNCNLTRVNAVKAMTAWLAGDPTGQGERRTLVIGDLNSYDHEAPIRAFAQAGYTDLERRFQGEHAYSYVFDGGIGYLDYALSNTALTPHITGAAAWHINADESSLFDYDMSFKKPAEQGLYSPTPYRSSDHDPVLVGLRMRPAFTPSAPYTSPGTHRVGGQLWRTRCVPHRHTTRCEASLWVTRRAKHRGRSTGVWELRRVTYLPSARAMWRSSPLGGYGRPGAVLRWRSADGARRTLCDVSGQNACHTSVWRGGWKLHTVVMFS